MPSEQQLIQALRQADAAGDTEAANRFAELIKEGRASQPQEKEGMGHLQGGANLVAQGATLGFADEGVAALAALVGKALPESMGGLPSSVSYSEAYEGIRNEIRGNVDQYREESPKAAMAAELVGGLATGGLGASKVAASKALTPVTRSALAGAGGGAIAGAGYSEGETLGEVAQDAGAGALVGGALGGGLGLAGNKLAERATNNKQLQKLLETNPDGRTAKYVLNQAGKRVKDKKAIEAIDQGFDQGVVSVIKGASKEDKSLMRRMVNNYRQAKNNPAKAAEKRPMTVLGDSIAQRYRHVQRVKKEAGSAIDSASKALKGKPFDARGVSDEFLSSLEDAGIRVGMDDAGKVLLNFDGSEFQGLTKEQGIISRVLNRMSSVKEPDAFQAHQLKRYIDNNVTYGVGQKTGAEARAESLIKGLRANLDSSLDSLSPAYDKANTLYAKSTSALQEVDSLLGKSKGSTDASLDRSLGTLSRRISSNAMSGGRVDDAVSNLSIVANETGGKFKNDLGALLAFADEMERVLPTQARTSLQGQTQNVAGQAARAAVDPRGAISDRVIGALSKTRNDETRLDALRRLLGK